MSRIDRLSHEFVEFMPDSIEEGTLYVSMPYATAVHKCCCGCGNDVVTPFSPTDWIMTFDGASISLRPSIGNWSFPCRSHYWIKGGRVDWAEGWADDQVRANRDADAMAKAGHYSSHGDKPVHAGTNTLRGWWARLKRRIIGK